MKCFFTATLLLVWPCCIFTVVISPANIVTHPAACYLSIWEYWKIMQSKKKADYNYSIFCIFYGKNGLCDWTVVTSQKIVHKHYAKMVIFDQIAKFWIILYTVVEYFYSKYLSSRKPQILYTSRNNFIGISCKLTHTMLLMMLDLFMKKFM